MTGLPYDPKVTPTAEEYSTMLSMSPIVHASKVNEGDKKEGRGTRIFLIIFPDQGSYYPSNRSRRFAMSTIASQRALHTAPCSRKRHKVRHSPCLAPVTTATL